VKASSRVGVALGALAAIPTVAVSIWAAGAGHGSYAPAIILFPAAMLSIVLTNTISKTGIAVALLQFPLYGFVLGRIRAQLRLRLGVALAVIHAVFVLAAFLVLRNGPFN
jgi:hypothetical protein